MVWPRFLFLIFTSGVLKLGIMLSHWEILLTHYILTALAVGLTILSLTPLRLLASHTYVTGYIEALMGPSSTSINIPTSAIDHSGWRSDMAIISKHDNNHLFDHLSLSIFYSFNKGKLLQWCTRVCIKSLKPNGLAIIEIFAPGGWRGG